MTDRASTHKNSDKSFPVTAMDILRVLTLHQDKSISLPQVRSLVCVNKIRES